MRIAHVSATFPPDCTGAATVCYHDALGLARMGHEVTVLTAERPLGDWADPEGLTVRRLRAALRTGNAPCLPGLLRLKGYDIVHLHYPFYFGGEAVFLGSLFARQKYVVTYHQDVLFRGPLRAVEAVHHALLGRQILGRAERVLATSLDYARASRLSTLLEKAPSKVGELPNGVDVERFHPEVESGPVRTLYGIGPGERVVLFVGGLDKAHYFKGVEILLQALALRPDDGARLLIVGEGDRRQAYQKQAAELGLLERVRFCGRVSDKEMPSHYAACDVLVLPSTTMGEAFGVVLLEAMASGKPVIASNLPGVRTVVRDGVDGTLVRPGDAQELSIRLGQLLDRSQEERRSMGELGRKKVVERYSWERIVAQLETEYQNVIPGVSPIEQPRPQGT
jgi:glycosyltransferase involved in cell wall biosynthesis